MRVNLFNALTALETSYTKVDMLNEAQAIKVRKEAMLKQQ